MAVLTTAMRKALPTSKFALPGRRYPVNDKAHANNALARVSQNGTPSEKSAVRSKVKSLFGRKPSGDGRNGGSDNDGY